MSHQIDYNIIPYDGDKSQLEYDLNEKARYDDWQEGSSGLPAPIQWKKDLFFETEDEAQRYIESRSDQSWYLQIAVPFFNSRELWHEKRFPSIDKLYDRLNSLSKKIRELENDFYFRNHSSKFVGCKECGSRVSVEHSAKKGGGGNYCPVCGADLRPLTYLDRIQKLNETAKEVQEKINVAKQQQEKKFYQKYGKDKKYWCWLVKTEYHC